MARITADQAFDALKRMIENDPERVKRLIKVDEGDEVDEDSESEQADVAGSDGTEFELGSIDMTFNPIP